MGHRRLLWRIEVLLLLLLQVHRLRLLLQLLRQQLRGAVHPASCKAVWGRVL